MTVAVLDSSALIAALMREPGAERVGAVLNDCTMSTVNFSEVVAYGTRRGRSEAEIRAWLEPLKIEPVDFDLGLAYDAGLLMPVTKQFGLSFGDRACLTLARRLGVKVLTTDRAWQQIADAVGIEVEVIR